MTPKQFRMARAALRLGIREVAKDCNVSTATITRIENEDGDPRLNTIKLVRSYFEQSGIEFIPETPTSGAGVRLKKEAQ